VPVLMTDIEIRNQPIDVAAYSESAMDRLGRWLQQADAVFAIAERICSTSFAPSAYRGKPAEAAAAMLAGAELGFDPMASLRAFDSINGVPAPKAITLRAVTLAAGHEIETVEQSPARAVVRGRRFGKGEWQTSTWDLDRARKLPQFSTNANYKNNPAAMLVARATAEVCRWIASDAVMGMPYAAEEIGDQTPVEARPIARKVTVAELEAMSTDEVQTAVHAGEIRLELITDQQRKAMFGLWAELGYDNNSDADRATRLEVIAKLLDLESLETTSDLTRDQAEQVLTAFRARRDAEQGGAQ
jgi:hypothetical protein